MTLKWPPWTGKPQRPVEPSGKAHDCPKFQKSDGGNKFQTKWIKYDLKPEDFDFCQYCGGFCYKDYIHEKYPTLRYISLEDHINMFHPNGEIIDLIDFKCISDEEKEKFRKKWNHPKIEGKFYLQGKLLRQDGNENDTFI